MPRQSVQTGIHLASYKKAKNVQRGWSVLETQFSKTLKGRAHFIIKSLLEIHCIHAW